MHGKGMGKKHLESMAFWEFFGFPIFVWNFCDGNHDLQNVHLRVASTF